MKTMHWRDLASDSPDAGQEVQMSNPKIGFAVVGLLLGIGGCASIDNGTTTTPLDPVKMQAYLQRNFSHVPNITEAMSRVIQAANGGHPAGVTYTQTASGITGTILLDVKGDGTDSATVKAAITYNNPSAGIAGGATAAINSITSPNLTGSANANLAVNTAGSVVTVSSGTANLKYTSGPELAISGANITVSTGSSLKGASLVGMTILGSADFHADNKSGTIFFESNGSGGWRIRVVSPDFATFTVP